MSIYHPLRSFRNSRTWPDFSMTEERQIFCRTQYFPLIFLEIQISFDRYVQDSKLEKL